MAGHCLGQEYAGSPAKAGSARTRMPIRYRMRPSFPPPGVKAILVIAFVKSIAGTTDGKSERSVNESLRQCAIRNVGLTTSGRLSHMKG
jgi:hypothetical protein